MVMPASVMMLAVAFPSGFPNSLSYNLGGMFSHRMIQKNALFIASNYWRSPFQVGSHFLARGLVARGWRVGFISSPISPWHFMSGATSELQERWKDYRSGGTCYEGGNITAYVPASLLVPNNKVFFLKSEFVARNWARFSLPNVIGRIRTLGFDHVDLLYFDNPYQNYVCDVVKSSKTIYRMADNGSGFGNAVPHADRLEAELVMRSDAVLFTSTGLRAKAMALDSVKAKYFPNGVEYQHFASEAPRPRHYEAISGPIAVYVGELGERFDFQLLKAAADLAPEVTFVLIGPAVESDHWRLPRNVQFLGPIDYQLLPQYLQHATVGIIPLNVRLKAELVNGVNPLKLYQYMAAGLPVVATSWDALAALGSPALLAEDPAGFVMALRRCIGEASDRTTYRRFAAQHDWSAKILELESIAVTN